MTHLAAFVNGSAFKPTDFSGDGDPVVRIKQLLDENAEVDLAQPPVNPVWLTDGDLVFSWSATLAVRFWQRGRALLNQHLYRVDVRPGIDRRWFAYVLEEGVQRLVPLMHGSAMTHITQDMLRSLTTHVPPMGEQRAIADYLDQETARIDALIVAKQRMLQLLAERLSELIEAQLWARCTAPVSALKRHLAQRVADGPHETPEFLDVGVPFISIEAVVDDEIDMSRARLISDQAHRDYLRKCSPQRGDVLLAKTGATIGKVAVVRTSTSFSIWSPLALLRPRPDALRSDYLWYALRSRSCQSLIREFATQSTQPNISMPDIAALPMRVPSLNEQDRVLSEITAYRSRAEPFGRALRGQVDLLLERRRALITAVVTGEIPVPVAA